LNGVRLKLEPVRFHELADRGRNHSLNRRRVTGKPPQQVNVQRGSGMGDLQRMKQKSAF
jgi:hypothetical protein